IIGTQAACAVDEIIAAIAGVDLHYLNKVNNIVTIGTVVPSLIWIAVLRSKRPSSDDVKVFFSGLIFWFLFVLHNNLSGLGIISGPPLTHGLEFIGFLGFVACLAYITIRRSFATEERLLAIDAELQIARQIQASTLPQQLPKLADLDIAARYVPMTS